MKKLLLGLLFTLLTFHAYSQTKKSITGFMSLKFGSTKQQVLNFAKIKGGKLLKNETTKLTYKGIPFSGTETHSMYFYFHNNKFYKALVIIEPISTPKLYDTYNLWFNDLKDVYGDLHSSLRNFKIPYKEGEGDESNAIITGYASMMDEWTDEKSKGNLTILTLESGLIAIQYSNFEIENSLKSKSDL